MQNHRASTVRNSGEMKARAEHATAYLPWRIKKHVSGMSVQPHWSADGKSLWYEWDTASGKAYCR